jgi:hypothetical protein
VCLKWVPQSVLEVESLYLTINNHSLHSIQLTQEETYITLFIAMDDELSEIIARDRESHPNCGYSESTSTSCSSGNGCETIREIMRMCPRQRPVTIYSKSERNDYSDVQSNSIFPGLFGSRGVTGVDDIAGDPWSILNGIFGGIEQNEAEFRRKAGNPGPKLFKEADTDTSFISGSRKGSSERI